MKNWHCFSGPQQTDHQPDSCDDDPRGAAHPASSASPARGHARGLRPLRQHIPCTVSHPYIHILSFTYCNIYSRVSMCKAEKICECICTTIQKFEVSKVTKAAFIWKVIFGNISNISIITFHLNLHYIAKSIGSPPSNDYFSNFHEYKS